MTAACLAPAAAGRRAGRPDRANHSRPPLPALSGCQLGHLGQPQEGALRPAKDRRRGRIGSGAGRIGSGASAGGTAGPGSAERDRDHVIAIDPSR